MVRRPVRKGFILAAGFGKRMKHLTAHCAKPMLLIQGRPLIDYTLFQFYRAGIDEAVINVHYLHQQIVDHLASFPHFPLHFSIEKKEILLTGGGIRTGLDLFSELPEQFLLMNPDTIFLFHPTLLEQNSLNAMSEDFYANLFLLPRPPAMRVTGIDFVSSRVSSTPYFRSENIETSGPVRFSESGSFFYCGMALCRTNSLMKFASGLPFEITPVLQTWGEEGHLMGSQYSGSYFDVGTLESYEEVTQKPIITVELQKEWDDFITGW